MGLRELISEGIFPKETATRHGCSCHDTSYQREPYAYTQLLMSFTCELHLAMMPMRIKLSWGSLYYFSYLATRTLRSYSFFASHTVGMRITPVGWFLTTYDFLPLSPFPATWKIRLQPRFSGDVLLNIILLSAGKSFPSPLSLFP